MKVTGTWHIRIEGRAQACHPAREFFPTSVSFAADEPPAKPYEFRLIGVRFDVSGSQMPVVQRRFEEVGFEKATRGFLHQDARNPASSMRHNAAHELGRESFTCPISLVDDQQQDASLLAYPPSQILGLGQSETNRK